jgi:hypothetical protein
MINKKNHRLSIKTCFNTKDGLRRIEVTGYDVYEMDEDDLEEFGGDPEYYFSKGCKLDGWKDRRNFTQA